VARNSYLRNKLKGVMAEKGIDLFAPSPEFCTDNGAMIAIAGYDKRRKGESDSLTLDARSRFPLG
jgi:N6-L-threonylcarbamoyladenine synthase